MIIQNKKASYENTLFERIEAGIVLSGGEAKAIREGRADLGASVVRILGGEAYLINANIPAQGIKDTTRMRKLLLHKSQLISLLSKMKQKKLILVPTKMYNKGRLVKVEVALAKPKHKFEKKEALKKKDIEREIEKELKDKI